MHGCIREALVVPPGRHHLLVRNSVVIRLYGLRCNRSGQLQACTFSGTSRATIVQVDLKLYLWNLT